MKFLNFFTEIFNVAYKARAIREDEVKRQKSVHFAVTSMIFAAVAIAFACLGGFLLAFENTLYILTLVVGIGCLAVTVVMLVGALVRVIAQFSINKKAASWVALVFLLAAVAACVVALVLFLNR